MYFMLNSSNKLFKNYLIYASERNDEKSIICNNLKKNSNRKKEFNMHVF